MKKIAAVLTIVTGLLTIQFSTYARGGSEKKTQTSQQQSFAPNDSIFRRLANQTDHASLLEWEGITPEEVETSNEVS